MIRSFLASVVLVVTFATVLRANAAQAPEAGPGAKIIRVGIIGLDTSHAPEFTKILNRPTNTGDLAGVRVVAAFPGGSPDLPESANRVQQYTQRVADMGVEIVDSIPKLLDRVDVVLLESVDGRPHLEQVRPVFAAHKVVFIDKPLAASLPDVIAIAELGRKYNVPWFSSSSLRYGPTLEQAIHDPALGKLTGASTWGPAPLEKHHVDLYWYGIHGVEMLYTAMGTGCRSVTRVHTEGTDVVVGTWSDGRIGTFRGLRDAAHDYGAILFGTRRINAAMRFEGYEPLVQEIAKFYKTGHPPIRPEETIEIFTFMEAADESKRQNGAPVQLDGVLEKARKEADAKLAGLH
jgi:hypothetical protein